jgi:hypothetical protein
MRIREQQSLIDRLRALAGRRARSKATDAV